MLQAQIEYSFLMILTFSDFDIVIIGGMSENLQYFILAEIRLVNRKYTVAYIISFLGCWFESIIRNRKFVPSKRASHPICR
jgi:hypothetical protein